MRLPLIVLNRILRNPITCKPTDQSSRSSASKNPVSSARHAVTLAAGILGIWFILGTWPSMLWAAQVTVAWDACTNPVPEGYRIFQRLEGQAFDYTQPIWQGNGTSCTLSNLADGTPTYLVIRSYAGSNESADSHVISFDPANTGQPGNDPIDADGDGVPDSSDAFPDNPTEWQDTDQDGIGDNADTDSDNDGIPDKWEILYGLDPLKNDALEDADGDGISNLQEYQADTNPKTVPNNHAPNQPLVLYPQNGANGTITTPELQADLFSDPDAGNTHARSHWQIEDAQNRDLVLDVIISDSFLSRMLVPDLVLDAGTDYICRVRYFDQHKESSPWSMDTAFRTADTAADANNNGIADDQEVTDQVDLNGDGVADNQQETIKSITTTDGLNQMGICIEGSPTAIRIASVTAMDAQDLSDSLFSHDETPFGLLGYKIEVRQPGDTVEVKLVYSKALDPQTELIGYDSITGFHDLTDWMQIQEENPASVRLLLQDGGAGDADGVENGTIVGASGPLSLVETSQSPSDSTSSSGGSGGGGCFIGSLIWEFRSDRSRANKAVNGQSRGAYRSPPCPFLKFPCGMAN